MRLCEIEACNTPAKPRLCPMHYRRIRLYGKPEGKTKEEKFWEKVQQGMPDECWPFIGKSKTDFGYGIFSYDGCRTSAHRVSYRITHGEWPELCLHTCDNPPCCNPAHLFSGNQQDNIDDCVAKGRNVRGHGERISQALALSDKASARNFRGEKNPRSKLSREQVEIIRELVASGESQTSVAKEFGMSQQQVSRIVRHVMWEE